MDASTPDPFPVRTLRSCGITVGIDNRNGVIADAREAPIPDRGGHSHTSDHRKNSNTGPNPVG
ncbi:hypothetical protein GCM10007417_08460 [Glycocaulis alkaliphilus]|nr:hypothetical protein GCM10007417_08460 [Glycocaulis alkaliphilus]